MTSSSQDKKFSLRQHRINKASEFDEIFGYRIGVTGGYIKIIGKPQNDSQSPVRIAFIVSKKVAKRAHDRNYMKRVLREITRHQQDSFQGLDIIFRVTKAFRKEDHLFAEIQKEVLSLHKELAYRIRKKQKYEQKLALEQNQNTSTLSSEETTKS